MKQTPTMPEQALVHFFRQGMKTPSDAFYIGLELEHILTDNTNKKAVSFYGSGGVEQILEELSASCKNKFFSQNHLVGLEYKDYYLTLEPAAQIEISIKPQKSIQKMEQIYSEFRSLADPVLSKYGYTFTQTGYQPYQKASELSLIPKERYEMMDSYFGKIGIYGQQMMRGTASTQIAIDYYSEEDFQLKYKTAYLLAPIVQFLFDHAPVYEGEKNHIPMLREFIWNHVDHKRVNIWNTIDFPDMDFYQYARFVLETPIIVKRTSHGLSYSEETMHCICQGKSQLTKEDIDHMLSMVFPMVRLKHYIEIRYADSMPIKQALAYAVFIKGLFQNISETAHCFQHCQTESISNVTDAYAMLRKYGARANIYGTSFSILIKKLEDIVRNTVNKEEYLYYETCKERMFKI